MNRNDHLDHIFTHSAERAVQIPHHWRFVSPIELWDADA